MPWNYENKLRFLDYLYGERRYYRTFHHTIFSATVAGYVALIGLQANLIDNTSSSHMPDIRYFLIIAGILLGAVPLCMIFLFFRYHCVQGKIGNDIYRLQSEVGFPDTYLKDNSRYANFKEKNWFKKSFTGLGHLIFIIVTVFLAVANWLTFLFIFRIISV
ncbi:MAG: hypothetical protein A2Z15_07420 [Chloroflexi bacterium RBG_16_50_11]|nr:MAG: hypothetical protein A2Z15_07420 [Chloroflexi bacterium RBG_16_50_11]